MPSICPYCTVSRSGLRRPWTRSAPLRTPTSTATTTTAAKRALAVPPPSGIRHRVGWGSRYRRRKQPTRPPGARGRQPADRVTDCAYYRPHRRGCPAIGPVSSRVGNGSDDTTQSAARVAAPSWVRRRVVYLVWRGDRCAVPTTGKGTIITIVLPPFRIMIMSLFLPPSLFCCR